MHRYQISAYGNQNKTLQAACALRRRCDGQEDMTMTKLIEICKESGLPVSPLAVTRLELNCQLFTRIGECIAEYRDVQQLHLDRNRISRIENLTSLQHLRCLYLQGNAIRTIEGLDGLSQLRLLNLSGNSITRLSGLDRLPRLEALLVSDNRLSDGPSIQHLAGCSALCELDLGHNQLGDAEAVLQVLAAMPSLQTLTLAQNPMASAQQTAALQPPPIAHKTSGATEVASTDNMSEAGRIDAAASGPAPAPPLAFYRRTVVARCQHLTALDHRAVFPQERRYAEAWWQENQQRLAGQQYKELEGSADQGPMVAGTGASLPDGAKLPTDVIYPVLTRLDPRTLAVAALSCRFWAAVAAFPLARQRLLRAQAALCDTAAAVPRLAAAIMGVRRDELDELLLTSGPPARPLVQLFYALEVLWRRYLRRRARRGRRRRQSCLAPLQQQQQQQQVEQAYLPQNHWQCQRDEAAGSEQLKAAMQQHLPAVKSVETSSPKGSRTTTSSSSNGSQAKGNEDCELEAGEGPNFNALRHSSSEFALNAQPSVVDSSMDLDSDLSSDEGGEEISDLDPEPVDLDSQTWRMANWEVALELLQHRDFPLPAMLTALPLGPRALAALRCRTGSADDLDFYIPQLRSQDVARLNASAGRLAEWLLGVEAHCRAAHEADRARTWSWPRHMTGKHEAFVSSETPQRGHGFETREADSRAVAREARDIGRVNQSQCDAARDYESQAGADQAASGGGGTGGALNGCDVPYGGARSIEKGESRDAGPEVGKGAGSGGDVGIRGSADGRDGAPGMSHVGDLDKAGRGGPGRWPSAAAAAQSMRDYVGALLEERRAEAMARAEAEAEARAAAAAAAAAVATAGTTAATVLQFVDEPRPLTSPDPLRLGGHKGIAGMVFGSDTSRPCFGGAEDWEGDHVDDDSDATSSVRTGEEWEMGHED